MFTHYHVQSLSKPNFGLMFTFIMISVYSVFTLNGLVFIHYHLQSLTCSIDRTYPDHDLHIYCILTAIYPDYDELYPYLDIS